MPQPDKGIWPHLPSSSRPARAPASKEPLLAQAMFPNLTPPPQPKPAPNRTLERTEVSLAQRCDENPWLEHQLALSGLVRKR
jgi:hypothetical protein